MSKEKIPWAWKSSMAKEKSHEHRKVLLTWKSYMTMEKVHIVERFLEIGKNLWPQKVSITMKKFLNLENVWQWIVTHLFWQCYYTN